MHNCVLFGSASGGISMVSGALISAGYHMAERAAWDSAGEHGGLLGVDAAGDLLGLVHGGQARGLCIFRHPATDAQALLEGCPTTFDPDHQVLDLEGALQLWCRAYGDVLDALEHGGQWHFLHEDLALDPEGLGDLGEFLAVDLGSGSAPSVASNGDLLEASSLAMEIYAQLCVRAQLHGPSAPSDLELRRPQVSVLALIGPGDEACVPELLADAAAQEGVDFELVIIDQTESGGLQAEGAEVVRCTDQSRGRAWNIGAAQARADVLAWWLPGYRMKPTYLGSALDLFEARRAPMQNLPMARRSG